MDILQERLPKELVGIVRDFLCGEMTEQAVESRKRKRDVAHRLFEFCDTRRCTRGGWGSVHDHCNLECADCMLAAGDCRRLGLLTRVFLQPLQARSQALSVPSDDSPFVFQAAGFQGLIDGSNWAVHFKMGVQPWFPKWGRRKWRLALRGTTAGPDNSGAWTTSGAHKLWMWTEVMMTIDEEVEMLKREQQSCDERRQQMGLPVI